MILTPLFACPYFWGCTPPASQSSRPETVAKPAEPYLPPLPSQPSAPGISPLLVQSCRVPALIKLWRQRADAPPGDLPVGPGDVIDVSVPEIDELQNQKVRVSAEGKIQLPLVGTVDAAGLGESELCEALVQKLKVYMKNPRVELFVENYRSRGVAIMGAVQKPGYYDMADEQESLVSMMGLAGGLSANAAQKIIFSPARPKEPAIQDSKPDRFNLVHAGLRLPVQTDSREPVTVASPVTRTSLRSTEAVSGSGDSSAEHSIVLNIDAGGDTGCLSLPARPGDVIIVPVVGQVMVEGWVQNPGAFAITPGMTILGAVSAAGGPVFSWWVESIRTNPTGGKTITRYTLSRLESGQEADPPVESGDVLLVEKTMVGAFPYALYSLFAHFGTGMALPIF